MEDKKKFRPHFNIFDALIIVLALAVLGGAVLLRNRSTGTEIGRATVPMRYTVEMTKAPEDMAEHMKTGESVYRATDGAYLGKIAEVRSAPHAETGYSFGTGSYVRYEFQESWDVYLTIENDSYSTARDIVVGTVAPKVCGEMPVKGKGYASMGYVVGIDTMGAEIEQNTAVGTGSLEATYVIRLDNMRTMLLDTVHAGDRMYEKLSGALLGEVVETWWDAYGETHIGPDGQAVYAEKDGFHNLYIRLKGRVVERDDGYYLDGGTELKVGALVKATSQYIDRQGIFYALEGIEKVQ